MAGLEIWIGRSGSGKSTRIASRIRDAVARDPLGPRIFWVVPGEASYAAERGLLRAVPASLRAEVLSLRRLAERVLAECNPSQSRINRTGKRLLLAAVYQRLAGQLQVLHRVEPSIPFFDAILDTFAQMAEYLVAPGEIASALEAAAGRASMTAGVTESGSARVGRSLYGKLRDLCLLYVHYRREVDQRDLFDEDELLPRATDVVAHWPALAGGEVYVDGFTDLTPAAREFVLALAGGAARTVVTLPLDPQEVPAEDDLSPASRRLLDELTRRAREVGLPVYVDRLPEDVGRFAERPDLAVVERYALADDRPSTLPPAHNIQLAAAQNGRVEAEQIACEIARLVHREGYAYADIAVLVPRLDEYGPLLGERFAEHRVPYDSDEYPSLATHPLAKFTLAVLAAVEDRFSLESMLRLIRTEFCQLTVNESDWLEPYLIRHELEGPEVWRQDTPWSFAASAGDAFRSEAALAAEDGQADALRRRVAEFLVPFFDAMNRPSLRVDDVARQIWGLYERVGAKAQLARWLVDGRTVQDPIQASLHEQAWQKLLRLIDDFAQTLPDAALPRSFLFNLVRSYIHGESLATIPAGLDRVLVSEYGRAVGWERRVVFVAGASDGRLPPRAHDGGLLRDEEREQFTHWFGRRLGETRQERQAAARTQAYFTLTRAKERLILSYPLSDPEGKELRPSLLVERLRGLFEPDSLREAVWQAETTLSSGDVRLDSNSFSGNGGLPELAMAGAGGESLPVTPAAALAGAIRALRGGAVNPLASAIMRWHLEQPHFRCAVQQAFGGLTHRTLAEPLPSVLAEALYRHDLIVNVYQLETFAACPYRHFAQYGLRLNPTPDPDVTPAQKGTLLHECLYVFVTEHSADVEAWRRLSDEEAVQSMREVFTRVLASDGASTWRRRALRRQQAYEVLAVLEAAAVVLTRHARHGEFVPAAVELSFGDHEDDALPAFEVQTPDGRQVALRGRLDRIDVVRRGERLAFRVIDYKSSVMDVDLTRVAHGLRLQLPIYAAMVAEKSTQLFGEQADPAGMLYIPLQRRVNTDDAPTDAREAAERVYQRMQAKGWLVGDDELIQAMDRRIASGGSELFPKVYKKDGSWLKTAPVLTAQEWRWLLARALAHVKELAMRMRAGEIDIQPYRLGTQETACDFCPYSAICHIDQRWDPRPFRRLQRFSKERLPEWAEYTGDMEGESGDAMG
jgi:ATP-dependent helicase/nuclease subunit B